MSGVLPDCDLFNEDVFKEYCKDPNNIVAQNPCDCNSYIDCGSGLVQHCPGNPGESFFSQCSSSCTNVIQMQNCEEFCVCIDDDSIIEGDHCKPSRPGGINGLKLVLSIGIPILVIVVILCFCLWRKRRWGKTPDRHPTPWYQVLCILPCLPCSVFKNKLVTGHNNRKEDNLNNKKNMDRFSFQSNRASASSEHPNEMMTPTAPFNKHIYRDANIFPLELLDMGQTLGRGAYGKVYKGWIRIQPDLKIEVAVKTSTRSSGSSDIEREARVFLKLTQKHMNIVNLVGVCLPSDPQGNPMLLLELCEVLHHIKMLRNL